MATPQRIGVGTGSYVACSPPVPYPPGVQPSTLAGHQYHPGTTAATVRAGGNPVFYTPASQTDWSATGRTANAVLVRPQPNHTAHVQVGDHATAVIVVQPQPYPGQRVPVGNHATAQPTVVTMPSNPYARVPIQRHQ